MAIFLHHCRYWETSFLLQIYVNYSLCRIYFGFRVHTCLFFGIQISETKYPQVTCGDFIKSTWIWTSGPWDFSHFSDFLLEQGVRKSDKLPLVRTENLHQCGFFLKGTEAEFLWSNVFADLNLTSRKCIIIRLISTLREKRSLLCFRLEVGFTVNIQ